MAAKIIKISCDQSCSMQKQFLRRPLENGESENNNKDLAENPHGNPGPSYCAKTSGSCSVHACEARHLSLNGDELRVTRALRKRGSRRPRGLNRLLSQSREGGATMGQDTSSSTREGRREGRRGRLRRRPRGAHRERGALQGRSPAHDRLCSISLVNKNTLN